MWWNRRKSLAGLHLTISREDLLRRSRLLVVDDERPDIIDDLQRARFSVDYQPDITNENLDIIDRWIYDLILLDFGNVGAAFGHDQGLSLLKHIKRVNPGVVVLAYTSKALATEHANFYILADGVLAKDAGITESMEKIEDALRKAHSLENLWAGLLTLTGIRPGSDTDKEWQDLLVRGSSNKHKFTELVDKLKTKVGPELATKIATGLLQRLLEGAITALVAS